MATYSSVLAWRIPMDRGTWQATVHGVRKSQTQLKRLITYALKLLANAVRQKKKKKVYRSEKKYNYYLQTA